MNGIKVGGWVRYGINRARLSPWSFLMATSISPSPSKENASDTIHGARGDDREQNQAADSKILRRATLKIDFCLISIIGLFCVCFVLLVSSPARGCH
jgi:hypothetical protein